MFSWYSMTADERIGYIIEPMIPLLPRSEQAALKQHAGVLSAYIASDLSTSARSLISRFFVDLGDYIENLRAGTTIEMAQAAILGFSLAELVSCRQQLEEQDELIDPGEKPGSVRTERIDYVQKQANREGELLDLRDGWLPELEESPLPQELALLDALARVESKSAAQEKSCEAAILRARQILNKLSEDLSFPMVCVEVLYFLLSNAHVVELEAASEAFQVSLN